MEKEIKEKLDVQVESEDSEDSIQQGIQQKRDAEPVTTSGRNKQKIRCQT